MDDAQQRTIANELQKPSMIIWYVICLEMIFWLQNTIKYGIDSYRPENIQNGTSPQSIARF